MEWLRDLGVLPVLAILGTVCAVVVFIRGRRRLVQRASERLRLLGLPLSRVPAFLGSASEDELDRFLRSPEPPVALGRLLDGFSRRGIWSDADELVLFLWGAREASQERELRSERRTDVRVLQLLSLEVDGQEDPIDVLTLWIRGHRLLALLASPGQVRKGAMLRWWRDGRSEHARIDSLDTQSPRVLWISCRKGMSWEERRSEYRTQAGLGAYVLPGNSVRDVVARHLGSHDEASRTRAKVDLAKLVDEHGIHVRVEDISRRGARITILEDVELQGSDFWVGLSPAFEQDLPEVLLPARLVRKDRSGSLGFAFRGLSREVNQALSQWILALQRREKRSIASKLFSSMSGKGGEDD